MKQMSQKRADQKLAKELKKERKKANKAQEAKGLDQRDGLVKSVDIIGDR